MRIQFNLYYEQKKLNLTIEESIKERAKRIAKSRGMFFGELEN